MLIPEDPHLLVVPYDDRHFVGFIIDYIDDDYTLRQYYFVGNGSTDVKTLCSLNFNPSYRGEQLLLSLVNQAKEYIENKGFTDSKIFLDPLVYYMATGEED